MYCWCIAGVLLVCWWCVARYTLAVYIHTTYIHLYINLITIPHHPQYSPPPTIPSPKPPTQCPLHNHLHNALTPPQLEGAELLWVDSLGAYFCASANDTECILRVPFPRPVQDERDARSALTMLAQVAWERERRYTPVMPSVDASAA